MSHFRLRLWRFIFLTPLLGVFGVGVLWALGLISFIITILVMTPADLATKTDGIVILTGGADRVRTGLELLQNHQARELLISGVNKNSTLDDLIKASGIKNHQMPCCITLGFNAVDTVGNARETATWVTQHRIKNLRLVTANYHMPRALIEMKLALPTLQIIPYPVHSKKFEIWTANGFILTLEEYHKTILVAARQLVKIGRTQLLPLLPSS